MLPQKKKHRLRKNRDFQKVYGEGRFIVAPDLVLYLLPKSPTELSRIGYAVARKTGKAVKRNQLRRKLRHLVISKCNELPKQGYDFILTARLSAREKSYHDLEASLHSLLTRLKRHIKANHP
jgi:ribonuclease P protein component